MNASLGRIALLALVTLLVGCGDSNEDLIVGKWRCVGDSPEASVRGDMEYVSNGDSNESFAMTLRQQGVEMVLIGFGAGTWSINGDELVERAKTASISLQSINGIQIPKSRVPDELQALIDGLKETAIQTSTASKILTLDENSLVVESAKDLRILCTRK